METRKHHRQTRLAGVALLAFGLACAPAPAQVTVEVSAPDRDYRDYPVTTELSKPVAGRIVALTNKASGRKITGQVWRDGDKNMLTFVLPELKRGTKATYSVAPVDVDSEGNGVDIRKTEEAAEILIDGSLFTRYVISDGPKPYCYPVIGPTGAAVTRNYPMKTVEGEKTDHRHHRSLWFTHEGIGGENFWHESGKNQAREVHRTFKMAEGGPVMGRLLAVTDYLRPNGEKVCEDERDIRIYKVANGRLFDWKLKLKATEGPMTIGDSKEGTFGIRVASTMKVDAKKGGKIVNSNGQTDKGAWGKRAAWCDYSGPVEGKTVGISIFDHPKSFRHPTYWHVRTYGLYAANPFGLHHFLGKKDAKLGEHKMAAGESLTFRYRVWIHEGTTEGAGVAKAYDQYTHPPKVAVR